MDRQIILQWYRAAEHVITLLRQRHTKGCRDWLPAKSATVSEPAAAAAVGPKEASSVVAAAAVANAYRESSLNPRKESDTGRYVGLFQLSPDVISSVEARKDPIKNTQGIISEALKSKPFMALAATETHIPTLAAAFCRYVERPKDKDGESQIRYEIAETLYPEELLQNSPYEHKPKAPPYRRGPFLGLDEEQQKVAVWLAVGAVVFGGLAYARYLKNKQAGLYGPYPEK
jgi:hypothetical protein